MSVKLHARQILDSRGNPTIEVEASLGDFTARASVPSGASTGVHEAHELRDNDPHVFGGKGVTKAVDHVNTTINKSIGDVNIRDQEEVDNFLCALDGTENKSHLGANAILGVSLALMKLEAMRNDRPLYQHVRQIAKQHMELPNTWDLPIPMMNIINGGKHADSGLSIQEFMILPQAEDFHTRLRIGAEIFHSLKALLKEKKLSTAVGDEGGFAPHINQATEAFDLILEAAQQAGHNKQIHLAIDAAASEFLQDDHYLYEGKERDATWLSTYYASLVSRYPLISIEDGHAEDDIVGWESENQLLKKNIMLVGDDLFVTNPKRLQMGIDKGISNSILIKLNQIGTVTETLRTIALARKHNMKYIISHRSGETEDTTIADFAVGTAAPFIKTGSLSRTERICKYNQLLRIEEALKKSQ